MSFGGNPAAAATLLDRLRPALHRVDPVPCIDPPNRGEISDLLPDTLRQAAVLVPVLGQGNDLSILLTRRHEGLREHAGQVSFPGGSAEANDSGPVATALREAHEEIGLLPGAAVPLGLLDPLVTVSAFHIWPVVAHVAHPFELVIDTREVSVAFEVPLSFLLDPGNCRRVEAEFQGRRRHWFEFSYEGHRIWGATAAMLVNLRDRMHSRV